MRPLIVTIIIVAVLGLLALTNPKMPNYEQFVRAQIVQKTEKADGLTKTLGFLFSGFASALITNVTTRADYVFFSIYDTKLNSDKIKVLGALNNFILLQQPSTEHVEEREVNQEHASIPDARLQRSRALFNQNAPPLRPSRIDYFPTMVNQWSPVRISAVDQQQPSEVVQKTEKPRFIQLLGKDYDEFRSYITVGSGISNDGDYLVGSGCTAHDCADKPGIFVIEIRTGRAYAAIIDGDKVKAWGVDKVKDLPYPISAWLVENKLKTD